MAAANATLAAKDQVIGIQIGSISFLDEGTEKVLDILQEKACVNTLFLATFTYGNGIASRMIPGHPFPDHGVQEYDTKFHGGNYATPHAQYYKNTIMKDVKAPDHGNLDILEEVIPKAKKHGVNVYTWSEDVWRNELLRSGAVKSVSVTNVAPWQLTPGFFPLKMSNEAVLAPFPVYVGYGFDKSLGLRFLAGRTFTAAMGDEDRVSGPQPTVIVDQTLARALGYPEVRDAVGKTIQRAAHSSGEPPVTIVGVVDDRPYLLQPFDKLTGHVYVPDPKSTWCLLVTLDHSRVREGLEVIDATWKHLSPAAPVDREFATDAFEHAYRFYRLFEQILFAIACGVTLVTLLGVVGFASLILHARSAEIGLRRVLGASAIGILGLLMRGFAMPLLVACLVAWPIAFAAARRYLQTFLQPIALSALPFILSVAALTTIVGIVGYIATSRAFRIQLATAVKHE